MLVVWFQGQLLMAFSKMYQFVQLSSVLYPKSTVCDQLFTFAISINVFHPRFSCTYPKVGLNDSHCCGKVCMSTRHCRVRSPFDTLNMHPKQYSTTMKLQSRTIGLLLSKIVWWRPNASPLMETKERETMQPRTNLSHPPLNSSSCNFPVFWIEM